MIALYRKNTLPIQVGFPVCSILFMGQMISPSHPYLLLKAPCLGWRRLSGDRTVVNFTMWSWVGLNVFMLIWRECLVLGDVRPVSTAASEHGVGGVGWGGGGMGWAYNVHGGCRKDVMLRHATVWRCWSNFRDALDATLWRCWSNFRDALDATLWRC